jgi:glycosyltransferase involved in cell wall biosynthesis
VERRLAWFCPSSDSRSGIVAYSAELLPLLAARGWQIDCYDEVRAHDFVWTHRRTPYPLVVYQLGNAACHDFMWGYLFRYPGMVVLHDAQLHQARALALTRRWQPRRDDYLAEFQANHPEAPSGIGDVIAAGLGQPAHYALWPLLALVVEAARLTLVHNPRLLSDLQHSFPRARIDAVAMGVADPMRGRTATPERRAAVRRRHGMPDAAVVLAAFGGMTPEKRIPSLLRAMAGISRRHPDLHLMLVGAEAAHYDARADAARWGLGDRVHATGYVEDADLAEYLLAADLCACLRWPTNRETSASLLRAMAAGRATIVSDLADLVDMPTIDPRGWQPRDASWPTRPPVAVSIDVLDEDHSLQLALDALVADEARRTRLGAAARAWWQAHHRLEAMAESYGQVLVQAAAAPIPHPALPAHLTADWSAHGSALAMSLGVAARTDEVLGLRPGDPERFRSPS